MYANQTQAGLLPESFPDKASAKRERQLPDQLVLLEKQVNSLDELFSILEQRLSPVCLALVSKSAETDRPYPNLCPAAAQLYQSRMQLESLTSRLHNLLSSLEV